MNSSFSRTEGQRTIPLTDEDRARRIQAIRHGERIRYDRLQEFRKMSLILRWPGAKYRLHRQRLGECCQLYDQQMIREADRRRGGRPKGAKGFAPIINVRRKAA